jgi:hypothetical protein
LFFVVIYLLPVKLLYFRDNNLRPISISTPALTPFIAALLSYSNPIYYLFYIEPQSETTTLKHPLRNTFLISIHFQRNTIICKSGYRGNWPLVSLVQTAVINISKLSLRYIGRIIITATFYRL